MSSKDFGISASLLRPNKVFTWPALAHHHERQQ
jgi:hypothetical protein